MGYVEEGIITAVEPKSRGSWGVTFGNSFGCGVRDVGVEPKVGDQLRTYGQFGYSFHGQALNGQVLWYLTPEQEEAERQERNRKADQDKRERFEADRERLDAAYETLPETFRDRIDKFRRTNPDWRWQYESYESMCCVDAVKIAAYCSTAELVEYDPETEGTNAAQQCQAYAKLPYEEQKKAGIDGGHSGNSFGFAVRLAYLWLTDPGLVVAEHGALTPLVGCETYGCPHPAKESENAE